jgi:hypothetical protein
VASAYLIVDQQGNLTFILALQEVARRDLAFSPG